MEEGILMEAFKTWEKSESEYLYYTVLSWHCPNPECREDNVYMSNEINELRLPGTGAHGWRDGNAPQGGTLKKSDLHPLCGPVIVRTTRTTLCKVGSVQKVFRSSFYFFY